MLCRDIGRLGTVLLQVVQFQRLLDARALRLPPAGPDRLAEARRIAALSSPADDGAPAVSPTCRRTMHSLRRTVFRRDKC